MKAIQYKIAEADVLGKFEFMEEALAKAHELAKAVAEDYNEHVEDVFVAPVIGAKDYCVGYAVLQRGNPEEVARYTVKATDGDDDE